jgi:uncharacterized membrane protein YqaE (UPF0057 family)
MNIISKIILASSVLSFSFQVGLALLLFRHYSPKEVGTFSIISQIGFFLTTLALAQAPLHLLANRSDSAINDAKLAWISCVKRFVLLLPAVALAIWWCGLPFAYAMLWTLLLSLCQLTWMLAQSMYLRLEWIWANAGVRVLPPLTALLTAGAAAFMQWKESSALLSAALLGYAIGAAWLFPVLDVYRIENRRARRNLNIYASSDTPEVLSNVDGCSSASLRLVHTLIDALLATTIVVVWQRLYGTQETGWMSATLRVMGFIPAVVHMAWTQVAIMRPKYTSPNPLWTGLCGFAFVAILGFGCAISVKMNWIEQHWSGILPYLLPMAVWQGSACLVASYSYKSFHTNKTSAYSKICIIQSMIQFLALLIPFCSIPLTSLEHIQLLSLTSSFGFFFITIKLIKY